MYFPIADIEISPWIPPAVAFGISLFTSMAVAPDWMLGLLFGVGGLAGMYCGARLQKFVPANIVKAALALLILIPAFGSLRSGLSSRIG